MSARAHFFFLSSNVFLIAHTNDEWRRMRCSNKYYKIMHIHAHIGIGFTCFFLLFFFVSVPIKHWTYNFQTCKRDARIAIHTHKKKLRAVYCLHWHRKERWKQQKKTTTNMRRHFTSCRMNEICSCERDEHYWVIGASYFAYERAHMPAFALRPNVCSQMRKVYDINDGAGFHSSVCCSGLVGYSGHMYAYSLLGIAFRTIAF